MVKPVKVTLPKAELCPHVDKLKPLHAHFGKTAFIARRHITAAAEQQTDKRRVADADAYDGNALPFQCIYVIVQCHINRLTIYMIIRLFSAVYKNYY